MRENARNMADSAVLLLYRELELTKFPICPEKLIRSVKNCAFISYEELAKAGGVSVGDVIRANRSADGCTHYDAARGRYLVAVNTSGRSEGRIRWTEAHELGHIATGHFLEIAKKGRLGTTEDEAEEEADYFASSLLAPFAAIRLLHAKCTEDVADFFGLSMTAAAFRWKEYLRDKPGDPALEAWFSKRVPKTDRRVYRFHTDRAIDIWPEL